MYAQGDDLDLPEQYKKMEDGELVKLAETDETALDICSINTNIL